MTSLTIPVRFSIYRPAYTELKLPQPRTVVSGRLPRAVVRRAVTDTGAQLNVLDLQTVKDMGIDPRSLTPTTTKIKGAGRGSKLDVEGSLFVMVEIPGDDTVRAIPPQQFFVVSNVSVFFVEEVPDGSRCGGEELSLSRRISNGGGEPDSRAV